MSVDGSVRYILFRYSTFRVLFKISVRVLEHGGSKVTYNSGLVVPISLDRRPLLPPDITSAKIRKSSVLDSVKISILENRFYVITALRRRL